VKDDSVTGLLIQADVSVSVAPKSHWQIFFGMRDGIF